MTFDDLLSDYGARFGLRLTPDLNRCCQLTFDDDLDVDLEAPAERPDCVFIHACLGRMTAGTRSELQGMLLDANHFGTLTAGFVFSVEAGSDEIVLHGRLTLAGLTTRDLAATIDRFVQQARLWTRRLAQSDFRDAAPGAAPPDAFAIRI
jgi:hypothetical protein